MRRLWAAMVLAALPTVLCTTQSRSVTYFCRTVEAQNSVVFAAACRRAQTLVRQLAAREQLTWGNFI